jgi:predicted MFS family arabinose efflux permease
MKKIFEGYAKVEKNIYMLVLSLFFIQLVNASFGLLRNYFMLDKGYKDYEIANFTSYNYIAIAFIAFPLGLFIKGRKLKKWFTVSMSVLPFIAMMEIYAIDHRIDYLIKISMLCWGIAFACLSATETPYLLLNSKKENHSEIFALIFQTFTISTILAGSIHYLFKFTIPYFSVDRNFLYLFSFIGLGGIYFLFKLDKNEITSEKIPLLKAYKSYDWLVILSVIFPSTIIAIGAGLTIQFINLFFENVHHMKSDMYALMLAVTYVMVAFVTILIPSIKKNHGYHIAITAIQVLAIIFLFLLATTEWYKEKWYAIYFAMIFFIIRQPLMNAAGPMTSELSMHYVGEKNRELVSSLSASIWSGSWFFSAKIFEVLRAANIAYSSILIITALMYCLGVGGYQLLIRRYYKKIKLGLIEPVNANTSARF